VIKSFKDKNTEKVWNNIKPKKFSIELCRVARRKLRMIDSVSVLNELKVPPRNYLEALKGDRKGQYSIRINDQWRVCFRYTDGHFYDVEITDYH